MASDSRALQIILTLKDQATSGLKNFDSAIKGFTQQNQQAIDSSKSFALGLAAVGASIGGLGAMALKSAADMEQTRIAFTTMLGSGEKAGVFIKDLVQFAKTTPFELKGLESASKQLLAYGFAQEDVLPNLKSLGDIAAGVGMDKLPNLILAFGQVKAATHLTGMELRQFTEAGVPLLDSLAKQFKKPVSAIQEMVSAGEIGFPAVQQALASLSGEGGRFNNLMEKQSKSLSGLISNLKDSWDIFLRNQGAALIEWAKQFVLLATDIVQNKLPQWIEAIKSLTKFFQEHQVVIYVVAGAIVGALVPSVYAAVTAFAAAAIALAPWIIGGAIIGGIIGGIVLIVQNWEMIKNKAIEIWTSISNFMIGVWTSVVSAFQSAWDGIKNFMSDSWNTIQNKAVSVWTSIADFFSGMWFGIVSTAQSIWQGLTDFFSGMWEGIKSIFNFSVSLIIGSVIVGFEKMGIDIVAVFQQIGGFIVQSWNTIASSFQSALTTISSVWMTTWNGVSDFFASMWNGLVGVVGTSLIWIGEQLTQFWGEVTAGFQWALDGISFIWSSVWNGIVGFLTPIWNGLKLTIETGLGWIAGKFKEWTGPLTGAWNTMWSGLTTSVTAAWELVKTTVKNDINWIIEKINSMIASVNSIASKGAGALGLSIPSIPSIPLLANGGIVTKPTLAVVGEAGPEAVIPLNRANGMAGGVTVNVTVNGDVSGTELVDRVQQEIMKVLRMNTRLAL